MYTYTAMATGDDTRPPAATSNNSRVSAPDDNSGFTQDWVDNHASRVAARQLEVRNVSSGAPRTQVLPQEQEEERKFYLFFFQFDLYTMIYIQYNTVKG